MALAGGPKQTPPFSRYFPVDRLAERKLERGEHRACVAEHRAFGRHRPRQMPGVHVYLNQALAPRVDQRSILERGIGGAELRAHFGAEGGAKSARMRVRGAGAPG